MCITEVGIPASNVVSVCLHYYRVYLGISKKMKVVLANDSNKTTAKANTRNEIFFFVTVSFILFYIFFIFYLIFGIMYLIYLLKEAFMNSKSFVAILILQNIFELVL